MKKLILIFGIFSSCLVFSQDIGVAPRETIKESVEQQASFPGGISAFRTEFANKIKTKKIKQKGVFRNTVSFVVEKDGTVSDVKADGAHADFNAASVDAVKKIKTKWIPALSNGKPVRYHFRFPATLNVE